MESSFKTPSKVPPFQMQSSGSSTKFTPKKSLIKKKNDDEINSVSRSLTFGCSDCHSPINEDLDVLPLSQQASCDSSSPFTPKRSRIKRKSNEESNSVSRILVFDNSNNYSPLNTIVTPLSQQALLPHNYEQCESEPTTPIKSQQPFIEKNNKILLSPSIKNNPKRFNITPSPKKRSLSKSATPKPSKKSKFHENENNNCKITFYFKPTQKRPDFIVNNVENNCHSSILQLGEKPSIKTENSIKSNSPIDSIEIPKLQVLNPTQLSQKTNQSLNIKKENINNLQKDGTTNDSRDVTPKKVENMFNGVIKSPITDILSRKVIISGGDTYSRFIKYIVFNEVICLGKTNIAAKIENCTNDELKLYGRLISRKHDWIRLNTPDGLSKYKELNLCYDLNSTLKSLATKQLINTDVTSCELDCLLNILKSHELKQLQKIFNINLNSNKKTKPEMIKSFINHVKNQRTFCGNSINNLKEHVKKILGYCLKLSDNSRDDIITCLIYESYPYFIGEEKDRFRECFNKFTLVEKNELKFPKFEIKCVSLNFNSEDNLDMYKVALNLRYKVQLSLEHKDHKNAFIALKTMFDNFKSAVCNSDVKDAYFKLPTYLRKYSAVSVYAHTLFKNIPILKKSLTEKDLAKEVLESLLKHKEFLISKQTDIRIELAKVFESQYKQLNIAAGVILEGFKNDKITELNRQMLSTRAVMYTNRKVRKLDEGLKNELLNFITVQKKLPSTTISGQIMSVTEKGVSGRKQVFVKKTPNGDIHFMSVEELALSHYKSEGFMNGLHDEGQFIKSMFLLCFWDIIYNSYPPHVLFIRKYQDCPLDWRTHHFYNIREKHIEKRMTELKNMSVDQICDMLKTRCDEYFNTQSVINWNYMNVDNLPQCKTLLESVGKTVFLKIGNQILKDGRIFLYGMPDLIVWDAANFKCKFVEVKGPNDKLSERQYCWLLKLLEFGAKIEVCHVTGTGSKNINSEYMD
ncbi:VRR-NUC domain [Cinara cedri]|uniref:Fanconi-associated nuclease n=1 Tax=Cinara cedri TaxID=506608 RepID=A0A5E4M1I2_9HEMI|nr:VRR-NUC domain [Cinara cedri]